MTTPTDVSDDSTRASAEEEEELRRMRQAILARGAGSWWRLLPRKTLFKAFWLLMLLVAILWLQRNAGRMAGAFQQSLSPATPSATHQPEGSR